MAKGKEAVVWACECFELNLPEMHLLALKCGRLVLTDESTFLIVVSRSEHLSNHNEQPGHFRCIWYLSLGKNVVMRFPLCKLALL